MNKDVTKNVPEGRGQTAVVMVGVEKGLNWGWHFPWWYIKME